MANVFGGGGSRNGTGISTSNSSSQTGGNANIGPSVLKQCNSGGGINPILSTSSEALLSADTQTYSSSPNNYSSVGSDYPNLNLRDFYTKADVHRLLKTKADISSVYRKSEVDAALATLSGQINQSLLSFVTEAEVDEKIIESYDNVISHLSNNYYQTNVLYTKSEVDSLLQDLTLGEDFVTLQPDSTLRNTIDPGSNAAIALTVKSSSNPGINTVQHWIDDQSNSIGRIRKSGQVEFYGNMLLGQAIEVWRPALDVSERRISGVADPVHGLDAINKKYLEDFVLSAIISAQLELDQIFNIDCLVY